MDWNDFAKRLTLELSRLPVRSFLIVQGPSGLPYVQAMRSEGLLDAEAVGSAFLPRPLAPRQERRLRSIGWEPPDEEERQNWWRRFPLRDRGGHRAAAEHLEAAALLAGLMVGAFRDVYGMDSPLELVYQASQAGPEGGPLALPGLGIPLAIPESERGGPAEPSRPAQPSGSALERALAEAREGGDQQAYLRLLARAVLYLPSPGDPAAAGQRYATARFGDGTFILAFTSPEAMDRSLQGQAVHHRRATLAELSRRWPNPEWQLAINPGLPSASYLDANALFEPDRETAPPDPDDVRVAGARKAPAPPAPERPSRRPAAERPAPPRAKAPASPPAARSAVPPGPPPAAPRTPPAAAAGVVPPTAPSAAPPAAPRTVPAPPRAPGGPAAGAGRARTAPDRPRSASEPPRAPRRAAPPAPSNPAAEQIVAKHLKPPQPPSDRRRAPARPVSPTPPDTPIAQAAEHDPRPEPPGAAVVMQKVLRPSHVQHYLEGGYDLVSGYVHRFEDVRTLTTPAALVRALGLVYEASPFTAAAHEIFVIRWAAAKPALFRRPLGGIDEWSMGIIPGGWVIEKAPFPGSGYAPGDGPAIPEYKIDSQRLPHGAELYRLDAEGAEALVAVYDADLRAWRVKLPGGRG
ncbi:SseB family protein [Spirillospora albida]|uniref:SseB family protein n=1 Tax=Spirillospora albida TaxID=58123 RepID=UPI0004C1A8D9|nr:SseB family protein [Spirillospora albida]